MALGSPSVTEEQSCSGFSLLLALFEGHCVKLGSSVSTWRYDQAQELSVEGGTTPITHFSFHLYYCCCCLCCCCCSRIPSPIAKPTSSGPQQWSEDQQLSGEPLGLQGQIGIAEKKQQYNWLLRLSHVRQPTWTASLLKYLSVCLSLDIDIHSISSFLDWYDIQFLVHVENQF